jgi:hypothetical protein
VHTGGLNVTGLIELQASVTTPTYPLSGFTLTVAWAPLPAGTLFGAMAPVTVIVKSAVTASTVKVSDAV